MSRLKKFIKVQSHLQIALQQLSADSRMSEEIKQFHSEQVEFADRDGVVKALNFLLGLVKSTAIPISDQIRSQISKLVSLLRIRDELQLHEQIRKREVGSGAPLVLKPECQIEFPHWDETFVMLKMKKISTTLMEDHRARQDLIASILRREAELERKKTDDAELKASIQAQKAATDQLLMQKSMDAAREKLQRTQDAAKEKEKRTLDLGREKEQRALEAAEKEKRASDAATDKEQRKLDLAKNTEQRKLNVVDKEERATDSADVSVEQEDSDDRMTPKQEHKIPPSVEYTTLKSSKTGAEKQQSKKKNQTLKVASEDSKSHTLSKPKTAHDIKAPICIDETLLAQPDIPIELPTATGTTKVLCNIRELKPLDLRVELSACAAKQNPANVFPESGLSSIETMSGCQDTCLPGSITFGFSTPSMMSSAAPCQSPKSVEDSPRHPCSVPVKNQLDDCGSLKKHSDTFIPIFETHVSNPEYGPWRPFISSSRHLPPVDAVQLNASPYEMALNLSCLMAVHSSPTLHETPRKKKKNTESSQGVHGCDLFPKKCLARESLPLSHQVAANGKLLEDMNFEEAQLDRALRALRRCTDTSNKLSMCAYEEILNQQRKLLSLLLPSVQDFRSGDQRSNLASFVSFSVTQQNVCADSDDAMKTREHFSKANRMPLKTNLAAQRRQVLLAKFSCPRSSSIEMVSSNSSDILHLSSLAESIAHHNRGDPALWTRAKRKTNPTMSPKSFVVDYGCAKIVDTVRVSFGPAKIERKSLLLGNFAHDIKSSLNRSFNERYSAVGRSVKW